MDAIIEAISSKTIGDAVKTLVIIIGGASCFVEFSKIKLNPLSWLLNWIGNKINGPLIAMIDALDKKQDEQQKTIDAMRDEHQKTMDTLRDTQDDNEIDRIRWEILEFGRSCRNKELHTLEEFNHVIDLYGKYHRILERRKLKNGQIELEYNYIIRIYEKCQLEDSFL